MISLADPLPFREALDSRAVKTLLPTTLRTRALERLAPAVRERAFWSAGVASARFLDSADRVLADILAGKIDRAAGRQRLDALRAQLDPAAEAKFRAAGKAGGLTDLWSERRQNILLETNVQMARGFGNWMQGQDPDVLAEFPASEFVRVRAVENPREDWPERWESACAQADDAAALQVFKDTGRMVALKSSGVWVELSRFRLPYAPFDYGSGKGLQDVDRDEAEELGLLGPEDVVLPASRGFNDDLQFDAEIRSDRLLAEMEKTFGGTGLQLAAGTFEARPVVRAVEPPAQPVDVVRKILEQGGEVADPQGRHVGFDDSLLQKFSRQLAAGQKQPQDVTARLPSLARAIATVRAPFEIWRKQEPGKPVRLTYVQVFDDAKHGRVWGIGTVTDSGRMITFTPGAAPAKAHSFRKGTLLYVNPRQ